MLRDLCASCFLTSFLLVDFRERRGDREKRCCVVPLIEAFTGGPRRGVGPAALVCRDDALTS